MRNRALLPLFLAGMALVISSCGISVQTPSNSSGSTPPAGGTSSTPITTTAAATPTPATAGGPTAGPGGCQVAAADFPPSGVTLISCYTMAGEVTASGGFYDDGEGNGAVSCTDWVTNGEQTTGAASEVLPAPDASEADITVNGNDLEFGFNIGPYTGPGSYPSTSLYEFASYGDTDWDNDNEAASSVTAQVNADGSGTLKATLINSGGNGQTETITESWICVTEPGI
ncbi:MAG: hypothetical protein ABSA40_10125 [Candidatus Dormibacteria bacterium]